MGGYGEGSNPELLWGSTSNGYGLALFLGGFLGKLREGDLP